MNYVWKEPQSESSDTGNENARPLREPYSVFALKNALAGDPRFAGKALPVNDEPLFDKATRIKVCFAPKSAFSVIATLQFDDGWLVSLRPTKIVQPAMCLAEKQAQD